MSRSSFLVQRSLQKRIGRGCELRKVLLLLDRVIADVRYGVPLLVRDFAQLPLQIPKLFGDFGIVAAVLLEVLLQPCLALVLPPRVHVRVDLGVDPIRLRVVLVVLGVGEEAGVAAFEFVKVFVVAAAVGVAAAALRARRLLGVLA